MRFLSVCSGIEAASVAWEPLGWRPLAFAEIEAFPRAVLAYHYSDTPCHGDFTALREQDWIVDADLLVGGTPCQAFSVAGLRQSLADDRGNLSLEFIRLANAIDDLRRAAGREPAFVLWENVPGVLSVADNAFGAFLGGMVGSDEPIVPDGRWADAGVVAGPQRVAAWRVLDAQFFGVAQRRRRVFVLAVGGAGAWRCADALLPIIDSLQGHPAPRREAGKTAPTIPSRSTGGGGLGTDFDCDGGLIEAFGGGNCSGAIDVSAALTAHGRRQDFEVETFVAQPFSITPSNSNRDYNARAVDKAQALTAGGNRPSARGGDLIAFSAKDHGADAMSDLSPTLRAGGHAGSHANAGVMPAVAFGITRDALDRSGEGAGGTPGERSGLGVIEEQAQCLKAKGPGAVAFNWQGGGEQTNLGYDPSSPVTGSLSVGQTPAVHTSAVRRLTPRECERLQGFPDDYTLIPWRKGMAPDGPRYKALGNSMAVPVMRWIGERIEAVEAISSQRIAA